ncbi:MAG: 50S ribosomal protein L37ae [Candidatus Altiarchaeales archaeon]|nr:50S ribosomal protein L37ae [Candidatus Altiarchaeales archaeon]MBD3416507.1 50S ribosomal protein L37ae [Candidatus Altiarchaeales archaeon]
MYSHTKKVGSLGRYGTRVGRKIRNEAAKIEVESRKSSGCPSCSRGKLKRVSAGIWRCRTCKHTFTGGTHIPVFRRMSMEEEQ